ncbi:hypothetical protein Gpo141_00011691 [Globisporangium polare]
MGDEFSDDDGFGDFLSEDEEECALQVQEMAALERKMKTAGIRDGIEFGKEDTLQQGFDQGFSVGAVSSYRFSVLRGALSAAKACGLLESLETEDQRACEATIASLKAQEVKCAFPASATTTTTQLNSASVAQAGAGASDEEEICRAQTLLEKLQIHLPFAELIPVASSASA